MGENILEALRKIYALLRDARGESSSDFSTIHHKKSQQFFIALMRLCFETKASIRAVCVRETFASVQNAFAYVQCCTRKINSEALRR